MAKKSDAKNQASPKTEKPKHNDEQYGEVLYSYSYDLDDLNYFNASGLVGPGRMQQIFALVSMALLLVIIGSLYDTEPPLYPVAITAVVLFFAVGAVMGNWTKIRDRYVSSTNLAQTLDARRHVVVTPDAVVVEGPEDRVETLPLSDLRKVAADDEGVLAKFTQRRYAYVPVRALSDQRYHGLVKLLREKSA